MKKFISLLISICFLSMPVFAYEYDFSDEAQAEFDRQQSLQGQKDYSKARYKREIKTEEENRTNYIPSENLLIDNYAQPEQPSQEQLMPISQPLQPVVQDRFYGAVVKVPAGTSFDVTFDSGISSGSMAKNDRLTVRLTEDLIYNGQVIAPAGSLVYGTATDAQNAGYAYGSGAVELSFNQILTPDGNMLQISTKKIVLKSKSERAVKMTRDVVVGTLGSMLLGAAFTAMGGGHDWGRNMLIYGGIGALGGGIHGAMQRGEEIEIPDGTTIRVTLTDMLTASPYRF